MHLTDMTHLRAIREYQVPSIVCLAQTAPFIRSARRLNSVGIKGDKAWYSRPPEECIDEGLSLLRNFLANWIFHG